MSEKRPLEVDKMYILVAGSGEESPVVVLSEVRFNPDHVELELDFRTKDKVTITVNQHRLGREPTQVSDIRPVVDPNSSDAKSGDEPSEHSHQV